MFVLYGYHKTSNLCFTFLLTDIAANSPTLCTEFGCGQLPVNRGKIFFPQAVSYFALHGQLLPNTWFRDAFHTVLRRGFQLSNVVSGRFTGRVASPIRPFAGIAFANTTCMEAFFT